MKQNKRHTSECKARAVELPATGKTVPEPAEELHISASPLHSWRAGSQDPRLLRLEYARLQVENDNL